ncbi:MAG: metal-dependent hydrolase [Armatimonadetes bacterium]|nr:metal-dependent hydrolase [Candidatus Hippobium faecium]
MYLTFLGHAAFLIESERGNFLIDPFITGNPVCRTKIGDLPKIDYIFVTHTHGDHLGDALDIAKKDNAELVVMNEFSVYLAQKGIKTHGINFGSFDFPFGKARFVQASHSSSLTDGNNIIYTGNPFGVVLHLEKVVYHAGDTGLISDFALLKDYDIDYALLPCGGNFTMDTEDFIRATGMIGAKKYIPMHYNTFGLVDQSRYEDMLKKDNIHVMHQGERIKM